MSFFNSISQNVTIDEFNSSNVNLSSSNNYSFTGSATSTLGVAGIQITLNSDKNCIVYVEQSPDGNDWDIVDSYNFYSSIKKFGVTVQAINSYFRVRVSENEVTLVDTSYFRLQSALCPIVEAVPRSLDERGNFKVGVNSFEDHYGFEVENTPIGEMRSVIPHRLVGSLFGDSNIIDPNFWVAVTSSLATGSFGGGQLTLSTGTGTTGTSSLYSFRRARYVSANSNVYRAVVSADSGSSGNIRQWGIAYGNTMPTITDGAWFELSGSEFQLVTMKNSVRNVIPHGSFNGHLGGYWDPTPNKVNTYEIYWTNTSVWFSVADELLHKHSATTSPWANTPSFYVWFDNKKYTNDSNNLSLYSRVASIRRLGPLLTQPTSKFHSGIGSSVCKYGPGNLHHIILSSFAIGSRFFLYDSTGSASNVIFDSGVMSIANPNNQYILPQPMNFGGIPFYNGLTIQVASASCNVFAAYE